jgi:hypothetical protein
MTTRSGSSARRHAAARAPSVRGAHPGSPATVQLPSITPALECPDATRVAALDRFVAAIRATKSTNGTRPPEP